MTTTNTTTTTGSHRAVVTTPSDTELEIARVFRAPPALVYRAWTTPALIRRWWSGDRGEVTVAEVDLRVGGGWRYVMVANRGFEVAFHGVFREIVPNERLVNTEVFEAMPHAEALNVVTFAAHGAGTRVTIRVRHATRAERDLHLNSGMEAGMQEAMDHLERVAAELDPAG
ncbi:MAG: SRPBCC family protein [Myxococcota bacterium]